MSVFLAGAQFHFLRPLALLLCVLVPLYWWRGWAGAGARLHDRIDPVLRDAVLVRESAGADWRRRLWLSVVTVFAALALAGPAWREEVTPIYTVQAPLVLAVDMSGHMLTNDIEPDRLTRVRYKLLSLLRQRQGGQLALIAFAGDAFTVAPMTDDANTVANLLDALAPRLLPVSGQNPALALALAERLIHDAGFHSGEVLLVTDRVDAAAIAKAADLRRAGVSVSVLGVGTVDGAPLRDADGALVNDAAGNPQWARLDPESLAALAAASGGRWQTIASDERDLIGLGVLHPDAAAHAASRASGELKRYRDEGIWLLPVLLLLFAIGFRRGGLLGLLAIALWPVAPACGFDLDALWRNREQRADAAMADGDYVKAQALSRDPARIGAAAYRAGDWQAAIDAYAKRDDAEAHYNRGNALARAGRLDEALAAYDAALARAPELIDAKKNRAIVAKAKQQWAQQESADRSHSDDAQDRRRAQQGDQQPGQGADQSGTGQKAPGQAADKQDAQGGGVDESGKEQGTERGNQQREDAAAAPPDDGVQQHAQGSAQDSTQGNGEHGDARASADARTETEAAKAMQQAIDQTLAGGDGSDAARTGAIPLDPARRAERERHQAIETQLRRIPDDPGYLLRQKFWLEYQRRQQGGEEE